MKCNAGKTDRIIRVIAGLAIGIVGYYYQSWWGLVGLIPVLTGVFGYCLLYPIFGISTCKLEATKEK